MEQAAKPNVPKILDTTAGHGQFAKPGAWRSGGLCVEGPFSVEVPTPAPTAGFDDRVIGGLEVEKAIGQAAVQGISIQSFGGNL